MEQNPVFTLADVLVCVVEDMALILTPFLYPGHYFTLSWVNHLLVLFKMYGGQKGSLESKLS